MAIRQPRYSKEEFAQRGDLIYQTQIRPQVEAGHHGKIVAINIETGAFEVAETPKIERLMQAFGRESQGAGCIYFTGGASALLIGWRSSTVDVDIRLDPEPLGIFQAIAKLKNVLKTNQMRSNSESQ